VKTLPVGGESETVGVAVGETVGVASDTSDTQMLPSTISTAILAPKRQKNYRCRKRGSRGSNKDAGSIAVSAHRDRIPRFILADRRIFDKGGACVHRIPNRSTRLITGDGDDLRACMTKKNDDLCKEDFVAFKRTLARLPSALIAILYQSLLVEPMDVFSVKVSSASDDNQMLPPSATAAIFLPEQKQKISLT
jgi:hypothetical protein